MKRSIPVHLGHSFGGVSGTGTTSLMLQSDLESSSLLHCQNCTVHKINDAHVEE